MPPKTRVSLLLSGKPFTDMSSLSTPGWKKATQWISFWAPLGHVTDVTVRPHHATRLKVYENYWHLLWLELSSCCLFQGLPDLPCDEASFGFLSSKIVLRLEPWELFPFCPSSPFSFFIHSSCLVSSFWILYVLPLFILDIIPSVNQTLLIHRINWRKCLIFPLSHNRSDLLFFYLYLHDKFL